MLNVKRKGIYLTPDLEEDLRKLSFESRQSESKIVRAALVNYLDREPEPETLEPDEYEISSPARDAIRKLAEEKNVPIPKVIELVFRKQIPKYFE